MTVSLRNVSGDQLLVAGKVVEPDEIVPVDGKVDTKGSPDDAYLIGDRLWPTATWTKES
jgi:hypothetical protein